VVVTGVGSVAVDDVRSQVREAEGDFDLEVVRVSMSRPAALRRATDAHAIVITRGGGEGVHVLDDDDLIRAAAASPVPVAVALGHASDDLVVGRVADASFTTPTAFGGWPRSVVEEKRTRHVQAEEGKLLLQSQSLVAPVQDQHLAGLAHHDVGRLEVAVDQAAPVGERHRRADLLDTPTQRGRPSAGAARAASSSARVWPWTSLMAKNGRPSGSSLRS
jgi:exonuclease VII large subunit